MLRRFFLTFLALLTGLAVPGTSAEARTVSGNGVEVGAQVTENSGQGVQVRLGIFVQPAVSRVQSATSQVGESHSAVAWRTPTVRIRIDRAHE